jgi:hypothetical protein
LRASFFLDRGIVFPAFVLSSFVPPSAGPLRTLPQTDF